MKDYTLLEDFVDLDFKKYICNVINDLFIKLYRKYKISIC